MPIIIISTKIKAPIELCFNLSRSIDLHKISAFQTKEKVIGGRSSGLIQLNETVTWKAKHFGLWHTMKVGITQMDEPNSFVDEMIAGRFKSMKHLHKFEANGNYTMMTDRFEFESPFGFIGKLMDKVILKSYLTNFLKQRNRIIVDYAESEKWQSVLAKK